MWITLANDADSIFILASDSCSVGMLLAVVYEYSKPPRSARYTGSWLRLFQPERESFAYAGSEDQRCSIGLGTLGEQMKMENLRGYPDFK